MATSLSRRQLAGLGALALLPRLLNLGSFSLWLDEVIETEQADGSLGHLFAELRQDAVHPPLEGLLTWALLHLGFSETARRLVPVALGVATVLLLAAWAGRRFGERAGLAVGAAAALSPAGVHYAQELRPYALALFLMTAALLLLDRLLDPLDPMLGDPVPGTSSRDESPGTSSWDDRAPGPESAGASGGEVPGTRRSGPDESPGTTSGSRSGWLPAFWVGLLFLAVAGCFYSLYLSALVVVPLGWLALETAFGPIPITVDTAGSAAVVAGRRRARRLLAVSPLFFLTLGLAYLPWLPTVLALRSQRIQRAPGPWTWGSAFDRFEDLTVGGGGPVPAWAGALALAVVVVGLLAALRRAPGRVAIAGFLAGTVGVEVLLAAGHHWSSLRYDLVGWPFLMVILGLGVAELGGSSVRRRWVAVAGFAILAVAQLAGCVQYYLGREDWQRVAQAVAAARRPAEPAFALNQSTRICLLYYLDVLAGRSPAGADPPWFASIDGSAERLAELWPADRCALLVTQSWGRQGRIVHLAREFPQLADYPSTFARLFLLTPQGRDEVYRSGRRAFGPAMPGALACDRTLPPPLAVSRAERRFGPLQPALKAMGYGDRPAARQPAALSIRKTPGDRNEETGTPRAGMEPALAELTVLRGRRRRARPVHGSWGYPIVGMIGIMGFIGIVADRLEIGEITG